MTLFTIALRIEDRYFMTCRRIIALILVCCYLLLPPGSLASSPPATAPILHGNESLREIEAAKGPGLPGPGSDQQWFDDFDCDFDADCDSGSDSACFESALSSIAYLASTTPLSTAEPLQRFPQVYLPIFVPPPSCARSHS